MKFICLHRHYEFYIRIHFSGGGKEGVRKMYNLLYCRFIDHRFFYIVEKFELGLSNLSIWVTSSSGEVVFQVCGNDYL